jgi:catechol 2,3-dioxygenase-like lactoylglutathione lyase family enzyme
MSQLVGINHIGVPVRSLEDTVAWYSDVFAIEPTFRMDPASGADVEAVVQVEDAIIDCAFFLIGNTCLEFLEYRQPKGRDFELRNCDVGAVHICFEVDDIADMYERLKAKGVNFSTAPGYIEDGPLGGISFVYFRDLQGLQFELFQVPAESPTRPQRS